MGDPNEVQALHIPSATRQTSGPIINGKLLPGTTRPVTNPADRGDVVGESRDATADEIASAFAAAEGAGAAWNAAGGEARAECLEKAADRLQADRAGFHELLVREAGKTITDAIAEVREAVDFCRYYALRARKQFGSPQRLEGPTGELNELSLQGRGVFACISPWNFPLAIFAGQVTAALAAGNAVVAKPAEPTPLIAARFVRLLSALRLSSGRRVRGSSQPFLLKRARLFLNPDRPLAPGSGQLSCHLLRTRQHAPGPGEGQLQLYLRDHHSTKRGCLRILRAIPEVPWRAAPG